MQANHVSTRAPLTSHSIPDEQARESKTVQQSKPVSVKAADLTTILVSATPLVISQAIASGISFGCQPWLKEKVLPLFYAGDLAHAKGYTDSAAAALLATGSILGEGAGKWFMSRTGIPDMTDVKSNPGWVSMKTVGKVAFIGSFATRNLLWKELLNPWGSGGIGATAKALTLACGVIAAKCGKHFDMVFKPVDFSDKARNVAFGCKVVGAITFVFAGGLAISAAPAISLGAIDPKDPDSESTGATILRTAIGLGAWFEIQDFMKYKLLGESEGVVARIGDMLSWTGNKLYDATCWVRRCGAKKTQSQEVTAGPVIPGQSEETMQRNGGVLELSADLLKGAVNLIYGDGAKKAQSPDADPGLTQNDVSNILTPTNKGSKKSTPQSASPGSVRFRISRSPSESISNSSNVMTAKGSPASATEKSVT